jgi:endonuclease YncB( thermonuclease family)
VFESLPAPDFTQHVLPATVVRWVDGDTCYLDVNLPFGLTARMDFRLYGIDTPERGRAGWAEASAMSRHLAPAGAPVSVRTFKDADKYGRYLAVIGAAGLVVNDELVLAGLAGLYGGGTRAPFAATAPAVAAARELLKLGA